ncbi:MAG: acyl-ACP--UDP-N-acetylglucosamine O-acyltransferase [Phycisphaerales bacterium]
MPTIHPTAFVDTRAQLADDVFVGPYSIIEGRVTLGPGCRLVSHVCLKGPLTMGENNQIYPFACIGYDPQDRSFKPDDEGPGTVIGDRNIFRESATIHRATKVKPTTIGSGNYFMANSHVAHDCTVGNDCMFANSAVIAGHVQVADKVILAGGAGVQQFCRMGRLSMLSGNEGITKDLPPFCIVHHTKRVGSLNVIGLRRNGYRDNIKNLQQAFDLLYKSGLTTRGAADRIEKELGDDPLCTEFADFIRAAEHGVTQYAGSDEMYSV